jgi:putative addiction module component (TIGR02574 family)
MENAIESMHGETRRRATRDALALPAEARAALIDSLVESLDQTVEEGAEEAWRREIEARLEQIASGAVKLNSWRDARQRFRDGLER